jgi:hypothetical protein
LDGEDGCEGGRWRSIGFVPGWGACEMIPIFANPLGLWMLLGVPAILAIHFLQQRSRVVRTSTWFLIEKLAPDSARGRTWDRIRSSRTLWLQLLAVILATWVLAEPRWVRAESAQTVAIVLDASASMEAFRDRALAAAEREMDQAEGLAARTTWVVMTTNPREPALYRGLSRVDATAALVEWRPELGRHDLAPALRLARSLAGAGGRTLLITDTREKAPADQRVAGVGRAIDNVGFAGATVVREGGAVIGRALIKNHATTPQRRTWQIESAGAVSAAERVELAAGAMVEISARFPDGAGSMTIVLSEDGFAADNRLPLLVPRPKPLVVSVDGSDDAAEFFRRLAATVDGVSVVGAGAPATLRLARLSADELSREPRGGIFWPPADRRAQVPLFNEPVTPERDPLVAGLNWQGWLGTGAYGFPAAPGDAPLLWQERWPLVFVRAVPKNPIPPETVSGATHRKLLLGFDWDTSNAARLPATVLLARRFLEAERDAQRAPCSANFDCGAPVAITGVPFDGAFTIAFEPAGEPPGEPLAPRAIPPAERADLRAPGRAGFFTVRRDDEVLVRGTAQFSDSRLGDFRAAETFFVDVRDEREAALERNTISDPFVVLWLALLAGIVLWSWWVRSGKMDLDPAKKPAEAAPALP